MKPTLILLLGLLAAGCGGDVALSGGGDDDTQAPPTTDLEFCVSETNRYRAMIGRPPLQHSTVLEEFATEGARADTLSGEAHGHFGSQGMPLTAFAENECPSFLGWTLEGNVHDTIAKCLEAFFKEGKGGGHYENMMGDHEGCGCGVYLSGDDQITITQDFR